MTESPIEGLADHIASKIELCRKTGCWLWQGEINRNGYGRLYVNGHRQMTHRFIYRVLVGNIGKYQLDHVCCTRNCVNPDHLEKVTAKENCRRRSKRIKRKQREERSNSSSA